MQSSGGGEKITVFGPNGEICSFAKPDSAVPGRGQTGSVLTVRRVRHAIQTPKSRGIGRQDPPPKSSFIIQGQSHLPALDVTPLADKTRKKTGLPHFFSFFFFGMIPWLFCDILDINIAGIPHIPTPCLYIFCQAASKGAGQVL